MFTAKEVEMGSGSKYQRAGVSEKVVVTEVNLLTNEVNGNKSIQFKTLNENSEEGSSKRLSLNTVVKEGNKTSAWMVTAKYLINTITSATGKSIEDAKGVLEAKDETELTKKLTNTLVGKSFRGLFSSREYNPGKFSIELYTTEPIGGTRLVYDTSNPYYNTRLPKSENTAVEAGGDLPF